MKVFSILDATILCPFQLINDLCVQLESKIISATVKSPENKIPNFSSCSDDFEQTIKEIQAKTFHPVCQLDSPTDWVNLDDSYGELVSTRAFELHNHILPWLEFYDVTALEFHIKLDDKRFTLDNLYSLIYLSESLTSVSLVFYVSSNALSALQQALNTHLGDDKNVSMVYQPTRSIDSYLSNTLASQLSDQRTKQLRVFGFDHLLNHEELASVNEQNKGIFIHYAWRCLKAGAYPLACQLLETVLNQSDLASNHRESLFLQLQVIRFLSQQHHLVVEADFPAVFNHVASERVEYLYFIRAFSATLMRNLPLATTCFAKAKISEERTMTDEDSLYQLNLYALFLVLTGKSDIAFKLEHQLLNYVHTNYPDVVALNHVVMINIARLHKKDKQFDKAKLAYQKSYSALEGGGFSLFDCMNYEMDKAILAEMSGDADQALTSWIKVAVHWLSCPNPYALALRPRLVLCQERAMETLKPLSCEKVCQFLFNKITTHCVRLNINTYEGDSNDFFDIAIEGIKPAGNKTCHINEEMVIYSYDKSISPVKSHRAATKRLRGLLTILLKQRMGISDTTKTIAIETNYEHGFTQPGLSPTAYALLTNSQSLSYNGEVVELPKQRQTWLETNIRIKLSPMISDIELVDNGVQLNYRRSYLNKVISNELVIEVINNLASGKALSLNELGIESTDTLYQLVGQKIIVLETSTCETIQSSPLMQVSD